MVVSVLTSWRRETKSSSADDAEIVDDIFAFGDDGLPGCSIGARDGLDDARVGRLVVGHEEEAVAGVEHADVRFDFVDRAGEVAVGLAQISDEVCLRWWRGRRGRRNDEPVVIVGDADADEVELAELLAAVFSAEDLCIVGYRRAEFVEPDVRALVGEFGVVEASVVGAEADAGVARRGQDVGDVFAGFAHSTCGRSLRRRRRRGFRRRRGCRRRRRQPC